MAREVVLVAALGVLGACGKPADRAPAPGGSGAAVVAGSSGSSAAGSSAAGSGAGSGCEPLPFEPSSPLPEASGAAWLAIDGKPLLVGVADSGQHGAYALIDPDSGKTLEQGRLPLDHGSDDLEGLAARGDDLVGLSSAGWIRVWHRVDHGFQLVDGPYPLGPVDLPNTKGIGDKPPPGDGMVCPIEGTNCGRNYEGLCLAPTPKGPCVGFAAAKADGHLYCLTDENHRLVVHHDIAIAVGRPGVVADCAFSDTGALFAGNNLFGMSAVTRIDGWDDPPHATLVDLGALGAGFPEVVAARGDVIYRMSDTGGAPSLMAKFRCPPGSR